MANIAKIQESKWVSAVEGNETGILQDKRTIVRKIRLENKEEATELLEILRFRTSVDNPDDGKRYYSVEDPQVNRVKIPGRWRGVDLKFDEGVHNPERPPASRIIQTLAYGWIKADDDLPTAVLLDNDKMLLSPFAHDKTSEKNTYVNEYRWIDPDYAETLRDTIALTEGVIDAKVIKQTEGYCNIQVLNHTNTWNGTLSQVWEKQDVYPTFAANKIINTYSHISLDALDAYKTTLGTPTSGYKVESLVDSTQEEGFAKIIQTQEKLFASGGDTTVSATNGTLQAEENLQLLLNGVVKTTVWVGVPDAALAAAMSTVATAPAGYSVLNVANNYNGTGSFTLTRTMLNAVTPASAQMGVQFPSFDDERRTYYYFGLTKTQADAEFITLQTSCDEGYKVDSVQIQEWRFNALVVVQSISKLIDSVAEASGKVLGYDYDYWGDSESVTKKWLGIEEDDLEDALTTLATAPDDYTTVSIRHEYDGTGKASLTRVVVKENGTGFEAGITYPSFMGETVTNIFLGLNTTDADVLYNTCQTSSDSNYMVDSVAKQEGKRGTITIVQVLSKLNIELTEYTRAYDYTPLYGLVEHGTKILLNIAKASVVSTKAAIIADTTKIVLSISDDDVGHGKANISYTWRSTPSAARSMGVTSTQKLSEFHPTIEDRQWIDISIDSIGDVETAVKKALAGSSPYTIASATEAVISAKADDMGDKTARITQVVRKDADTSYADYSIQDSYNPHGFQMAYKVTSIREYQEVRYTNVAAIFASLQTFITTDEKMKGRIQVRMNSVRANGTFEMRGLKEGTPNWGNTTPTYVQTEANAVGLIGERIVDTATGIPVADVETIKDSITATENYNLDGVNIIERDQGEAVIEKRQTKKSETAVQVDATEGVGWRRAEKRHTWPFVLAANIDTVWAAAETEGVADDFILIYRQKDIIGNGMYRVINHVVECTAKSESHISAYTDRSITTTTRYQDAADLPDATDTAGQEEHINGGPNMYGKYDYVKTVTVARIPKSCESGVSWVSYGKWKMETVTSFPDTPDVYDKQYVSGLWKIRIKHTHTIAFHTTASAAALAITGADAASGVSPVGDYLWQSHKVVDTYEYDAQISFSEPQFIVGGAKVIPPVKT